MLPCSSASNCGLTRSHTQANGAITTGTRGPAAQANEELTEALQQYENEQAVHFEQVEREREKRFKDPDDVFFAAADRKKEIREQMRELQRSLARQKATKLNKRR